eukprot:scaffold209858_cov31-Tisochrysis_lutea.AAC.2
MPRKTAESSESIVAPYLAVGTPSTDELKAALQSDEFARETIEALLSAVLSPSSAVESKTLSGQPDGA